MASFDHRVGMKQIKNKKNKKNHILSDPRGKDWLQYGGTE